MRFVPGAPRDIVIAGFDDIPHARYVHPSLATMRVDIAQPGGRALQVLLDSIPQEARTGSPSASDRPSRNH